MGQLIAKLISNPKVMAKVIPPSAINHILKETGKTITTYLLK